MTRRQQTQTFHVPHLPHGLIVVLTAIVLIAGVICLSHLADFDTAGKPNTPSESTVTHICPGTRCTAEEQR